MSSVFNDQDEGWDDLEVCNCEYCREMSTASYLTDEEKDLDDYDDNYLDDYLEDNFFDGNTDGE